MDIIISNSAQEPIYEQISEQLKRQIMGGVLHEGEALPSIRNLARELRISVITTKRAYEELEKEGFIETVAGKGTFVAQNNKDFLREKRLKVLEDRLNKVVKEAKSLMVTKGELEQMLDLLYEED